MATIVLEKKRKNIDLPVETLKKLSIMAASQGKSLKAFIENILIAKADTLDVQVSLNPSPSNDPWFDNPKNVAAVTRGIEDLKQKKVVSMNLVESFYVGNSPTQYHPSPLIRLLSVDRLGFL